MRSILLMLVLLAACTEPTRPGVAGTYALVSHNGQPLPASVEFYWYTDPVPHNGTLRSGILVIGEDQSFIEWRVIEDSTGATLVQPMLAGQWRHSTMPASILVLPSGWPVGFEATYSHDTLTLMQRKYVRQ